jgi:hypothetical protein
MADTNQLPDWFYVFVNQGNSRAVMNLDITGQYSSPVLAAMGEPEFAGAYADGSADFLPFVPNPHLSSGFMSPFVLTTINGYRIEYDAELARRAHFKDAPSRLTGIFGFESHADCEKVSARFGWDMGTMQKFKPQTVLRATRVNMEIVSLARFAYGRGALDATTIDALWRAYWGGADSIAFDLPSVDAKTREKHTADAIWEWIIDGSLLHESRVEGR